MIENKFTIIIPTRERANTLIHAIKTCTAQSYKNLEIIISDNYSNDNTFDVVESFKDSRIKYVNTGERLSMAKNYEFALSQVTSGWVCIIGDDDGLLPESIIKANDIVNQNPNADVLYWYNIVPRYFWAGKFGGTKKDNNFYFRETHDYAPFKPKDILVKMMSFEASYEALPILYHGFVKIELIKEIKSNSKNGCFFQARIPDVYSTIALAYFAKNIVKCSVPISIQGISNNSIGESRIFQKSNLKNEKQFLTENDISFHKDLYLLTTDNPMSNIYILIADAFLNFFDNVESSYSSKKEAYKKYILLTLAKKINEEDNDLYLPMGLQIINKNELDLKELTTNSFNLDLKRRQRYFYYIYSHKINLQLIKTETIFDVFDKYNQIIKLNYLQKISYSYKKLIKIIIRFVKYKLRIK